MCLALVSRLLEHSVVMQMLCVCRPSPGTKGNFGEYSGMPYRHNSKREVDADVIHLDTGVAASSSAPDSDEMAAEACTVCDTFNEADQPRASVSSVGLMGRSCMRTSTCTHSQVDSFTF